MAINETTQDAINNPGNTKTVTLDLTKQVYADSEGDEQYALTLSTTATSKITAGSIANTYIRDVKVGYSKSRKISGPFNIDGTKNQLRISIDGSTSRTITLTSGTGLTPNDVVNDLQAQISSLAGTGGLEEGNLGFLNADVEFIEGRFRILSGSVSDTFTGIAKSSVSVLSGVVSDATSYLGFNIPVQSEALASKSSAETIVVSGFTASGTTLALESVIGCNSGEAFTITDGVSREYFIATAVTSGNSTLTVTSGTINNNYAINSVVQKIFERDPDSSVPNPLTTVDEIMRFSLKNVVNQIDYTT